jgi:hypothetical protein
MLQPAGEIVEKLILKSSWLSRIQASKSLRAAVRNALVIALAHAGSAACRSRPPSGP